MDFLQVCGLRRSIRIFRPWQQLVETGFRLDRDLVETGFHFALFVNTPSNRGRRR